MRVNQQALYFPYLRVELAHDTDVQTSTTMTKRDTDTSLQMLNEHRTIERRNAKQNTMATIYLPQQKREKTTSIASVQMDPVPTNAMGLIRPLPA